MSSSAQKLANVLGVVVVLAALGGLALLIRSLSSGSSGSAINDAPQHAPPAVPNEKPRRISSGLASQGKAVEEMLKGQINGDGVNPVRPAGCLRVSLVRLRQMD
jgi:hypothetical protein